MDIMRALGGHPKWCFASVTSGGKPVTRKDVVKASEGIGLLAGDTVHAMWGMPDGSVAHFDSKRRMA